MATHPDATIVAGATDIGVRINKSLTIPRKILDLNRVDELPSVRSNDGELVLGARASWTAIEEVCKEHVPEFHKIVSVFGAPQIRHVGTIGGNIVNASPIADSLPFLHVMEATLELRSASGTRQVNINDFYKGYKKFDLRPGELITQGANSAAGRRTNCCGCTKSRGGAILDISTFTAAIRMRLDGETIADVVDCARRRRADGDSCAKDGSVSCAAGRLTKKRCGKPATSRSPRSRRSATSAARPTIGFS